MNIKGFEKITLGELQELYAVNDISIKDAVPIMKRFRDKHGFTDKQSLAVFAVAKRIFSEL